MGSHQVISLWQTVTKSYTDLCAIRLETCNSMATSSPTKSSLSDTSSSAPKSGSTTQNRYQDQDSLAEDFIGNPTRDTLAEGLIGLLTPSIENLDQGIALLEPVRIKLNLKNN